MIVEGNVIIGNNTTIDNGAILKGNIIIDDDVYIGDYCYVSSGSSIAKECYLSHASKFWGVLMRRVYLYHYM